MPYAVRWSAVVNLASPVFVTSTERRPSGRTAAKTCRRAATDEGESTVWPAGTVTTTTSGSALAST